MESDNVVIIPYATRIKEKIKTLREAYMQERFYDLIERDRVSPRQRSGTPRCCPP